MKTQDYGPFGPGAEPEPDPEDGALSYRRERFCIAFARHGNAARAARDAGYAAASAKQRGHRLLTLAPVRARIEEIAAGGDAEAVGETRGLMAKLETLFERALEDRAFHAAARAVELQARLAHRPPAPPRDAAATEDAPDVDALIARAEAELAEFDAGGGKWGCGDDGDDRRVG